MVQPFEFVDAIILAAGANTRLAGSVPSYMKPLLLSNGKPLIRHAIEHAEDDWRTDSTIIVASPNNIGMLVQVVPEKHPNWVIQPSPTGVIGAIHRGLNCLPHRVGKSAVLILCADNTFDSDTKGEFRKAVHSGIPHIATRHFQDNEATHRFTRLKYSEANTSYMIIDANDAQQSPLCWIGPLLLDAADVKQEITRVNSITQLIRATTQAGANLRTIPMQCSDLGILEELS